MSFPHPTDFDIIDLIQGLQVDYRGRLHFVQNGLLVASCVPFCDVSCKVAATRPDNLEIYKNIAYTGPVTVVYQKDIEIQRGISVDNWIEKTNLFEHLPILGVFNGFGFESSFYLWDFSCLGHSFSLQAKSTVVFKDKSKTQFEIARELHSAWLNQIWDERFIHRQFFGLMRA